MTYSKCIFTASCLFLKLAAAQSPAFFSAESQASNALQGVVARECTNPQNTSFDNVRVELMSRQNSNRNYSADVLWDGRFEIRDVSEGVYEAHVTSLQGSVMKRTIVTVSATATHQEVRLTIPCAEKQTSSSVSLRRLSHKPPKGAVKAMRKASEAQQKGNLAEWEKQLRLATTIDPEYFEARNNFGAFLARANRTAEALNEFRAALEIDPSAAAVLTNISASLLGLNETKEAEAYARRALVIDPLSAQAHYLIGVALVKQNRFTLEAADHLHDSASVFPNALEVEAVIRKRIKSE